MSRLKGILGKLFPSPGPRNRRETERSDAPQLAAFFWTGGIALEHSVRDISRTGLYMNTADRWCPGTLIMMTLQNNDLTERSPERSIVLQAKVVRLDDDGVGLAFIFAQPRDPRRGKNLFKSGADRKSLEKFLEVFSTERGHAIVHNVEPPFGQG